MNKCVKDIDYKLPFSIFKQKLEGDILYLNYDIRFHELSAGSFEISNIIDTDSIKVEYDFRIACDKNYTGKSVTNVNVSLNKTPLDKHTIRYSQFVPNQDYMLIFSKIKGGKVVKKIEWTGRFTPLEEKIVKLKFD
jgi:hypothetical protein